MKKMAKQMRLETEKIAVMVGRRPNTEELSLSMAGVKRTTTGHIEINEFGQTTTDHIYAIGDVVHRAGFSP